MSKPCGGTLAVFALLAALLPLPGHVENQGSGSQPAAPPFTFRSVSIDLPNGDRAFPPGPGADAVNSNCLACHSAGMVLNQPALPKATWEAEIGKMINVYKAPVSAEDVPAIVAYLDAIKGVSPAR